MEEGSEVTTQMPTVFDVARVAGVSAATVSRVLNGTARVHPDKVAQVQQAIANLGFKAKPFARGLLAGQIVVVGVMVPNLSDEFCGTLVTGVERALRARGVHMMCSLGHDDVEEEQRVLNILQARELGGLILLADRVPDDVLLELAAQQVPFVVLNRLLPKLAPHCIRVDNVRGGYLATQHLIESGHTRIAHLTGPLHRLDVRERLDGYRKALREAGLPFDELLLAAASGETWGEAEGRDLFRRLQGRTNFTALFAANDFLAVGALKELRGHGLEVPDDLSLVSYDNRSFTELVTPGLTTVDYPKLEMGQQAADHLAALIAGENPPPLPLLTPTLVIRSSTRSVNEITS